MMKILMTACFMPLVPIVYAMLRNEAKCKKNISLGVTLPQEAREDPAVADACRQYKKWLTVICAALLVFQIPFYFIPSTGVFMLVYMTWLLLIIALPYLPYFHYHKRLKALKEAKGWGSGRKSAMVVDLKAAAEERRSLPAWWFLPPVFISVIPIIVEATRGGADSQVFVPVHILLTLMVASFYLFYRMINRQRADVVGENTALNLALTRIRRYNWSKMWLFMAWLTGAFNFLLWFLMGSWIPLMAMMVAYMALCLLVVMQTEFAARRAQYRLTMEDGQGGYVDDDAYWPHGIFYYNPGDKHLVINNRTGIGTTVNMGRPAGKVIMALCALAIALLPFMGVWMMIQEAAPLTITVTEREIAAAHTGSYRVELDSIRDVELLEVFPGDSMRLMGTGMENLAKGTYQVPGIGRCEVNLDPDIGPFIVLRTEEKVYLFGTRDPEETVAAHNALLKMTMEDLQCKTSS